MSSATDTRRVSARFANRSRVVAAGDGARVTVAADSLRADAFTVNEHVHFARGRYAPETEAGRSLLAHELQSPGRSFSAARWPGVLDTLLTLTTRAQRADGSWGFRCSTGQSCSARSGSPMPP